MNIYELLSRDNFITVNKILMKKVGMECAVLLSELCYRRQYLARADKLQEDGYFYATVESVEDATTLSEHLQRKHLNNLQSMGIVKFERRGLPSKRFIYIDEQALNELLSSPAEDKGQVPNTPVPDDVRDCTPTASGTIINNNINNNNSINQSYKSINKIDVMDETAVYMTLIRENIDYDIMMQDYEWKHRDMYEELYQIICDVVCVPRQEVRIAGEDYPYSLVKSKFLKLKKSHLEYVIGCMERNTTKIVNIKAYLITALYNAPNTISHYYSAEVNHDMCGVRLGNCTGNQ